MHTGETVRRRSARPARPPEPEISPVGRIAGYATSGCLVLAGAAFLIASWDELTCSSDPATCEDVAGVGGLVSAVSLMVIAIGLWMAWNVRRRPVDEDGTSSWTWGLAIVFVLGVAVAATRIPEYSCPPGVHLDALFGLCITSTRRFDATSWLWLKRTVAIAGLVVGVTAIPSPRAVFLTAPLAVITWCVGLGWLLLDTMVRGLQR
jgi:hypothetical protein